MMETLSSISSMFCSLDPRLLELLEGKNIKMKYVKEAIRQNYADGISDIVLADDTLRA